MAVQSSLRRLMSGCYQKRGFPVSDFLNAYAPSLKLGWETVYTGTTDGNFSTCAVKTRFGNILFDKSLEPKHSFDKTFYAPKFGSPLAFAMQNIELSGEDHSPLILEGRCLKSEVDIVSGTLSAEESFLVHKVWALKSGVDWRDIDRSVGNNMKYFDCVTPSVYFERQEI